MYKKTLINVAVLATSIVATDIVVADLSGTPPGYATTVKKGTTYVKTCDFDSSGYPGTYKLLTMKQSALTSSYIAANPQDVFIDSSGACPASGWTYKDTYNSSTGKPDNMTDSSEKLPSDILAKVLAILPEGRNISANPALITDDHGANIFLTKDAHIKVAYVSEGAGYQNALGFFQFTADDLTNASFQPSDKIIYPNYSDNVLHFGDTVDLGDFTAGTAVGFTVVANGWKSDTGTVNPLQSTHRIFRTIKGINPEANADYKAHTVLLSSPQDEVLILAIEDLNRTPGECDNDYGYCSDEDFNDAVLAIFVTPFDAVDPDITCLTNCDTPPDPDCLVDCDHTNPPTDTQTGFSGRINWREKSDVKTDSSNHANEQTPTNPDLIQPAN